MTRTYMRILFGVVHRIRFKKIGLLGFSLILWCSGIFAQTLISGKVKDGKGHPVPGASITVKNSFDGATSDSSGNFHFGSSDTGLQTITVSSVGYHSVEVSLKMAGKSIELDLQL